MLDITAKVRPQEQFIDLFAVSAFSIRQHKILNKIIMLAKKNPKHLFHVYLFVICCDELRTEKQGGSRCRHCWCSQQQSLYIMLSSSCNNLMIASNVSVFMIANFANATQSCLPVRLSVHGSSWRNQTLATPNSSNI